MKKQVYFLALVLALGGCIRSNPTDLPPIPSTALMQTPTIPPVSTPILVPTSSPSPADVKKEIEAFLQTNGGCDFPCFWGIYPERTSSLQAQHFFARFGKTAYLSPEGGHLYESTTLSFKEYGRVYLQLDVQNDTVKNIAITLDGLWHHEILPQYWSAYHLDEILRKYGPPSSVELFLDLPNNLVLYDIRLTYEDLDTYIRYGAQKSDMEHGLPDQLNLCPSKEISDLTLKLGKSPINPEPDGVPLSLATNLDIDDFFRLFTGDSDACFTISMAAMGR